MPESSFEGVPTSDGENTALLYFHDTPEDAERAVKEAATNPMFRFAEVVELPEGFDSVP